MEWQELLSALGRFGLVEREAGLYLQLLRGGPATARELTRELRMDRVITYRILDGLRARGIVQLTAERPRKYVAIGPRSLFDRTLHERQTGLENDTKLAEELVDQLPRWVEEARQDAPRFQMLSGAPAIYPELRAMLRRAREDVAVMITQRALRDSYRFGVHRELPRLLRAGTRFRLVVESDPRIQGLLQQFSGAVRAFPNAELRQLYPQPARLTLIDQAEVLVFPVPEARIRGIEETAIWTNSPDFVRGQSLTFNTIWERAGSSMVRPPKATAPARAAGRAPPCGRRTGTRRPPTR